MTNEHEANAVRLLNLAESAMQSHGPQTSHGFTEIARVYAMLAANATQKDSGARAAAIAAARPPRSSPGFM